MSRQLFEYINPRDAKVRIFESEDKDGKKSLGMEGIFVQAEQRNQNGRVYPLEEIKKELETINKTAPMINIGLFLNFTFFM